MTLAIASLAGIPLTAGFLGKFLVFKTAVASEHWVLVGIGIVAVAAGFYYYIRVIAAMYWREPEDATPIAITPTTRIAITVLGVLIIALGILPGPVLGQLKERTPTAPAHLAQH